MSNKVVTAAYPFVPAEIETPHLASTYIPADIHSRYLEAFGDNPTFISGTEIHGFQAKQFLEEKEDPEQALNEIHRDYKNRLRDFRIEFDTYDRIDSERIEEFVHEALERLQDSELIITEEVDVYRCDQCKEYLPRSYRGADVEDVEEMECGLCNNEFITHETSEHLLLDISKADNFEKTMGSQKWEEVENKLESETQRLDPWDITRDNYFGVDLTDRDQSLYLWFESLVADIALLEDEQIGEMRNGEEYELQQFIGKNLTFYQGVLAPILYEEGLEVNPDVQLSPRGFMHPDSEYLDADKVKNGLDIDYFRFYVGDRVNDSMNDFDLSEEEMKDFVNNTVIGKIGTFFTRTYSILEKEDIEEVPSNNLEFEELDHNIGEIRESVENMRVNEAVERTEEFFNWGHSVIENEKLWDNPNEKETALLAQTASHGLTLLKPVMPDKTEEFNIFQGWRPNDINNARNISKKSLNYDELDKWDPI